MGSRGARPGLMNSVAASTFTTHRKGVSGGGKFPSSLTRPKDPRHPTPRRSSSTDHRRRAGTGSGSGGRGEIVIYKWRRTEQVLSGIVFTGLVAADLIIPVERRHFRSLRDGKYFTNIYIPIMYRTIRQTGFTRKRGKNVKTRTQLLISQK